MKVVQYSGNQVQTQAAAQPLASSSVPSGAFGEDITAGVQSLAAAGLQLQTRVATTEAESALVSFERDKNDLLFNPETGYFNSQGRNAFDGAEVTNKSLADLKTKYSESLSATARTMFDKTADNHITKAQLDIGRHASQGLKSWEVSTLESQVENSIESASLYWNDPATMKVQNVMGRQSIIDAANMQGLSSESINERLQTFDSAFSRAAIEAATVNSSAEGKKLFDSMGDRLEGQDKTKLQAMIQNKIVSEKTKADATYATIKGNELGNNFESRQEIIDEANKIKDAETRDKVLSQAMHVFSMNKQAESEARGAAYEEAEAFLMDGGTAESFQATNPDAWLKLSPKQQKMINAGKATSTDWETFSDLMTMPKEELSKVDPNEYFTQLAPAERGKLISAVRAAKGVGSDKVDAQVGRTRIAQTSSAVEQLFGPKAKRNDDKRERADQFYALVDNEVAFRESEKQGKLTSEEYTNLLNSLTRKVVTEGLIFNSDKTIKNIPVEDIDTLSDWLRDRKIPVTSENLLNAYEQASE